MSLRVIFNAFDKDGNGCLDPAEFGALLRAFINDVDEARVAVVLSEVDKDNSGTVEFEEFEGVAAKYLGQVPDLCYLDDFCSLDADQNGLLSSDEATALAARIGRAVDAGQLSAAGSINYPKFLQLLQ